MSHADVVRGALGLLGSLRASGERGTETTDAAARMGRDAFDLLMAERDVPPATEKLVRDCYDYLPHRVGDVGERYMLLAAKLDEEVAEVKAASIGTPEFVGELADLVEVCYALGGQDRVEAARVEKHADKGGFDRLLVMRLEDRTDK